MEKELAGYIEALKNPDWRVRLKAVSALGVLRTEESVNDALKRLQNTKNGIKEYFFWFQISDFE